MEEDQESTPAVVLMEELLETVSVPVSMEDAHLQAVLEAMIYVSEEPLTVAQMAGAVQQPAVRVQTILAQLVDEF